VSSLRGLAYERWSGAGNTFFVVEAGELPAAWRPAALARHVCAGGRGRSVDGLIVLDGTRAALWNPDGSKPAFCGNGARCVAARLMQRRRLERVRLRFGRVPLEAWREGREIALRVPRPCRLRLRHPARLAAALGEAAPRLIDAAWIRAGVPHLCLLFASREGRGGLGPGQRSRLRSLGARLRGDPAFGPQGTNVTFLWKGASDRAAVTMRTFERGVEDLTGACGSGALAAGQLLLGRRKTGIARLRVTSGATLSVRRSGSEWDLCGPARRIGRGSHRQPPSGSHRHAARTPRAGG